MLEKTIPQKKLHSKSTLNSISVSTMEVVVWGELKLFKERKGKEAPQARRLKLLKPVLVHKSICFSAEWFRYIVIYYYYLFN